ncbi:8561_t:CDS:2 [Paraglomus occultum]|uniref:8561_t:CDS:1 n=1 Tax=Paraglomus occultum TaxID=144539 RepID=A0A9N8Z3J8_9GLOM|nr:8561_t:CDS:2 [Paraglomus occultum]
MSSSRENPLCFSRYDLTTEMKRSIVAPPPIKRLIRKVSIDDWHIKTEGVCGWYTYTVYQISTVYQTPNGPLCSAISCKRYSAFVQLYNTLADRYGWVRLPRLPPKRYVGNTEEPFIRRRKEELESFLNYLIEWRDNDLDIVTFLGISADAIIKEHTQRSEKQRQDKSILVNKDRFRIKKSRSVRWSDQSFEEDWKVCQKSQL